MKSIITTHATKEATRFVTESLDPSTKFLSYLETAFPEPLFKCLRDQIVARYHPKSPSLGPRDLTTDLHRIAEFLNDKSFGVSHIRALDEMYTAKGMFHHGPEGFKTRVYNAAIEHMGGFHGNDVLIGFYQPNTSFGIEVEKMDSKLPALAKKWQSYLASYVLTGNPNTKKAAGAVSWPETYSLMPWDERLAQVLSVKDSGFSVKRDPQGTLQTLLDAAFVSTVLYFPELGKTNPLVFKFMKAVCVPAREYGYFTGNETALNDFFGPLSSLFFRHN
jgi:hypothetical protein